MSAILAALSFLQCSADQTLHWQEAQGYRWAELDFNRSGDAGFTAMPSEKTQILFQNDLTEELIVRNHVLLNGSGVAIGDIDDDGFADVYFCRLNGPNVLYKNLGNWRFQDVTEQAGVAGAEELSTGAVFADIDGDFDLDLLVTSTGGKNFCFLNDGAGTFTDASEDSGIKSETGATTMALADVDNDGDLDLYAANYKALRAANIFMPGELNFENIVEKNNEDGGYGINEKFKEHYDLAFAGNFILWEERGEQDVLYLNDGKGQFQESSFADGTFFDEDGKPSKALFDWGLTAKFQDLNHDGHPDLYVCNDFNSPDRIWLNDGTGRFHAIARMAVRHTSHSSMAVDFSDVERDGDVDLFVLDMLGMNHRRGKMQFNSMPPNSAKMGGLDERPQYMRNTLFVNHEDNTYAEIGRLSGVHASDWSWAVNFLDVDLDGYEDILITTGQISDTQNLDARRRILNRAFTGTVNSPETILNYPRLELPNVCFRNNGDLTFTETSDEWRWGETADISHGMALGDLDNDGDLDVVINRFQKPAALLRNDAPRNRIAIRLRGMAPNTQGIGAKIHVLGHEVPQMKEVVSGGTYLSGSTPLYSFAADNRENDFSIEINWRSGRKSRIENIQPNRMYEIFEAGAQEPAPVVADAKADPVFMDVSQRLGHKHHEEQFDDFARQPLLPLRLSRLGPGLAVQDLDGDGDDDLIITSGRGGELAYYENRGGGDWLKRGDSYLTKKAVLDQTAVVSWTEGDESDEKLILMAGFSNYENPGMSSFIVQYTLKQGVTVATDTIFVGNASIGVLAAADYDNDNDLDLFVGGRSLPGRYPAPPSSFLFKNEAGKFIPDAQNNTVLQDFGMVSNAVFSDIDNDNDPDIIAAVQWGPVAIFQNNNGVYQEATAEFGLDAWRGLWNGVTTADFNNDGKLDILATNWGRNSKYKPDSDHPVRIYYDDFDLNGTADVIEAFFDADIGNYVPYAGLEKLIRAIPYTQVRMPNFRKFAHSDLDLILGAEIKQAGNLSINVLDHTLFLSGDTGFTMKALPPEAQFASAFFAGAADFDGDGNADLFLSQNFFGESPEIGKDDAGRGLWLKGDGTGGFQSIGGRASGVLVYGEQRGAGFGDFDADGRIDLVVSQNGAETKLYENMKAEPCLRIKLRNKSGNNSAIGARVRIKYQKGYGPLHEIKAGSGYWSQNSATILAGNRNEIQSVEVFWPDGRTDVYEIPRNTGEVTCSYDGKIE